MTTDLTLVVVGKDWPSIRELFSMDHVDCAELVLVANQPMVSLAAIGNHYLEHARTPVLGLVHADCGFGSDSLRRFAEVALGGSVCGIVGVDCRSRYLWALNVPPRTVAPVETLDSCSIFLRKDLGLRFDAVTFNELHCHVEDVCMQAHKLGISVVVPACNASHRGVSNNNPPWRAQYQPYRDALRAKWGDSVKTT